MSTEAPAGLPSIIFTNASTESSATLGTGTLTLVRLGQITVMVTDCLERMLHRGKYARIIDEVGVKRDPKIHQTMWTDYLRETSGTTRTLRN